MNYSNFDSLLIKLGNIWVFRPYLIKKELSLFIQSITLQWGFLLLLIHCKLKTSIYSGVSRLREDHKRLLQIQAGVSYDQITCHHQCAGRFSAFYGQEDYLQLFHSSHYPEGLACPRNKPEDSLHLALCKLLILCTEHLPSNHAWECHILCLRYSSSSNHFYQACRYTDFQRQRCDCTCLNSAHICRFCSCLFQFCSIHGARHSSSILQ